MAFGSPSLKGKALQWLAQREHSRAELHSKLSRYAAERQRKAALAGTTCPCSAAEVTQVLDELAAAGFQSDDRTAETWARAKSQRYGIHRVRQQLKAKGLSEDLVSAALADNSSTELQRARDIWQRRYGQAPADRAEMARQVRFLTGRGFDSEVIRRVVRGAPDTD